jgi:outer membrane protein OmpA-like peptidoglycan-associated protein
MPCTKHILTRAILYTLICLSAIPWDVSAQKSVIRLNNPDFEGQPSMNRLPSGWVDCGDPNESAPDTQPLIIPGKDTAFFNVKTKAFSGKTYLGMVVRENGTTEAVSQMLSAPLQVNQCYYFNVFLARSESYQSIAKTKDGRERNADFNTPAVLRVWGGNSPCQRAELLGTTAPVINTRWIRQQFKLSPKSQNYQFILLEVYYQTPTLFEYNGNVLIDKASDIIQMDCDEKLPETDEPPIALKPAPKPASTKVTQSPPSKIAGVDRSQMRTGTVIRIDKVYFKADSSDINIDSYAALDEISAFLKANSDIIIEVGGHTNNIPLDVYCDTLSTRRARSVATYIVSRGIPANRVKYKGYGKRSPVEPNSTPEGRKRNQRVEIKILSMRQ